jgi:uncharacterized protein YPO0396
MSNEEPDRIVADTCPVLPGFRLERLELWNWGTFHGEAQVFEPRGGWALLVGDNGSGKSTAIDALRTLLVPPRMLNYNDASGDGRRAASRDRTRRSYVRGAWASSSTVDTTTPTTQFLREAGTLSAIAAVFTDARRQTSTTVAQVLWEHEEQIKELYAITPARRGLRELLAGHANTAEIKRAARRNAWQIEDSFAAYAERMRSLLHIPGDKALEVFNRAIGMKEIGDIDAFVRQFMLPAAETFAFIRDTLQPHYRTLLDCWSAIERAERQIGLLRPVAEHASRIREGDARIDGWKRLQQLAEPYFCHRHIALLRAHEAELQSVFVLAEAGRKDAASRLAAHRSERDSVNASIAATDVGHRLQAIARELTHAEEARKKAQERRERVEPAAQVLDAAQCLTDAVAFEAARPEWELRGRESLASAREAEELRAAQLHEQRLALAVRADKFDELESVERHRVNIPRHLLTLRERVAQAVGLAPEAMPFTGELIEVRDAYAEWTGAIERLLHGFGLSLLIPEAAYRPVAEYINTTLLGLRLTFHRVPARVLTAPELSKDRVPGRLEFRTEHALHLWVVNELVRSFNHRCCTSIAELEASDRGLTREGLIRDGTRHSKDDRRQVDDPSARILGWSTQRKIAALRQQILDAEKRAETAVHAAEQASRTANVARARANAVHDLLAVGEFADIDPGRWSETIIRLKAEQALLTESSDQLRRLQERLKSIEAEIVLGEADVRERDNELGRLGDRVTACQHRANARTQHLARSPGYDHDATQTAFSDILAGLPQLTLDNADELPHVAYQSLQGRISNEQRRVNEATTSMVTGMSAFLGQFPDFRQTLDIGPAYADDFAAVLQRIEEEDLPRHRERFEHYLNENLVGDLLMLNRRLDEHMEAIEGRIDEVNDALRAIDYEDDTYVQLRLLSRPGQDVTEFRRGLRSCFEYGIAPAPAERLKIFDRVRLLLDQFNQDPEGTQRLTDVRTWLAAGVRELRRRDDAEVNYYAATTGKSGGQKAKLAFTILASALTAQYGLSTATEETPNFRLVVIDEAFSRTDESNSTRAMQLFARLGFQLLIVGPFDAKAKLAVPFVQSVHLTSNPAGNSSRLIALTREQVDAASDEPLSQADEDASRSSTATGVPTNT